ncbi:EF-hand domain-containing protein [Bradyrhizobium sp. SRS-191]|uniref:EF-hand domain-containing protein n=1 Tax=Bradyrhizobium sp. SRS-191 TaxID=2962606 RepID=UPI00211E2640|nr:EF-hand domain-containing protein [Bradyrhizobium sp. SRS-191]
MWFALGAASSVLDSLQSIGSTKSGSGKSGNAGGLFSLGNKETSSSGNFSPSLTSGSGSSGQIAPETMNALLAAQSQSSASTSASSSANPLQDLFSQIDGDGDGQISKSEFENALGAGGTNLANADKVFGKLDANSDGNVSLDELSSALQGAKGRRGHHHQQAGAGQAGSSGNASSAGADALMQALSGASSSSSTNSDGSTTTTITYADGSKMTLITPAATTASNAATASYNMIEKLMQHQPKLPSAASTTAMSV